MQATVAGGWSERYCMAISVFEVVNEDVEKASWCRAVRIDGTVLPRLKVCMIFTSHLSIALYSPSNGSRRDSI